MSSSEPASEPASNRFKTAQFYCRTKQIPKQWFPVGKKVEIDHVKRILGRKTLGMEDEELEIIRQKIAQDRVEASTWGKQRVESLMAKYAKKHGVDVNTFAGLQEALRHNGSIEMYTTLTWACYLEWDKHEGWENDMEKEYMNDACLEFNDLDIDETKGCFARLFTNRKNEAVKSLNRIGLAHFGKKVKMKRLSSEINETNKFKKRKKGTILGGFLTDKSGVVLEEGLSQPAEMADMVSACVFVFSCIGIDTHLFVHCYFRKLQKR